jgi:hypothetical protein
MPDPFATGLDPKVVLRRWCELDCTALTELLCSGNTNPTPEQIALRNHQLFDTSSYMNPACITACDAAMPNMLSRPYAVNRYFFEKDGLKIGRQIYDNDLNICRPPPPAPKKISEPIEIYPPMFSPAPQPQPTAQPVSIAQDSSWVVPVGIIALLGVAMIVLAPELGVLAFLAA